MADGNSPRILPDLSQQLAQMKAMIEAQQAEITRLSSARQPGKLTLKVSERKLDPATGEVKSKGGALMVCGLGQWPTTLYASQWERLLAEKDTILAFIAANASTLTRKD